MPRDFRALIAEKVTESWTTTPHFYVTREIDSDGLLDRLAAQREEVAESAVTVTDLMLVALAEAVSGRGSEESSVDVGLAVATDKGVMIPILRDVLGSDLESLAASRRDAIERGRRGRLTREDIEQPPGTTLSNLGPFEVDSFTGVIPIQQQSMLTVGRISRRLVPDEQGRPVCVNRFTATLNADHRVLDGAEAAHILRDFAAALAPA
jgi:pyruvate dehydrogenase E2 component (dihydrolipoamide acetyltransferase)